MHDEQHSKYNEHDERHFVSGCHGHTGNVEARKMIFGGHVGKVPQENGRVDWEWLLAITIRRNVSFLYVFAGEKVSYLFTLCVNVYTLLPITGPPPIVGPYLITSMNAVYGSSTPSFLA